MIPEQLLRRCWGLAEGRSVIRTKRKTSEHIPNAIFVGLPFLAASVEKPQNQQWESQLMSRQGYQLDLGSVTSHAVVIISQ